MGKSEKHPKDMKLQEYNVMEQQGARLRRALICRKGKDDIEQ